MLIINNILISCSNDKFGYMKSQSLALLALESFLNEGKSKLGPILNKIHVKEVLSTSKHFAVLRYDH